MAGKIYSLAAVKLALKMGDADLVATIRKLLENDLSQEALSYIEREYQDQYRQACS